MKKIPTGKNGPDSTCISYYVRHGSRDFFGEKKGADGALLLRREVALDESQHETCLAYPLVSQHYHLKAQDIYTHMNTSHSVIFSHQIITFPG